MLHILFGLMVIFGRIAFYLIGALDFVFCTNLQHFNWICVNLLGKKVRNNFSTLI